jgi:hypothetical protein
LLTSVERVSELQESDVILGHLGDKVASGVELTEGELVVVLVVQYVEKIAQEGVEVLLISDKH